MEAMVVDPRDTSWESATADYRVFVDFKGTFTAYDLSAVAFVEAVSWGDTRARAGSEVSIALKISNSQGKIGLIWLT
ncbi:hypothetical protein EXU48_13395 [Occultella glacieicola]|uniref:Uncharacterized protein n=1 Tax=Occultella glacieicola TaxID=2518684 RepID=A0ABY2E267_9MICO|nr:hypothetical protein [Occultella glacieicola]TDE92538.1 hypothetical protein EXU48_13395 [Occultella glacieicola]